MGLGMLMAKKKRTQLPVVKLGRVEQQTQAKARTVDTQGQTQAQGRGKRKVNASARANAGGMDPLDSYEWREAWET